MNVLHLISTLDPATGGPSVIVPRLAAAQAALGHDVHIVHYQPDAADDDRVRAGLANVPHIDRVHRHALPRPGRLAQVFGAGAAAALAPLAGRPGILHLHGVWDPILRAAAALAHRRGLPYVVAPHGMLDPWSLRQRALKKSVALMLGYRKMLRGAKFLHTLNADERALIEPLKLGCPMEIIPNGIYREEVEPLPAHGTFRRRFPGVGDGPYVLFLSRLHFKKGLDYLTAAFDLLAETRPDVHLVIAGPDDGQRPFLRDWAARSPAGPRMHLVGGLYGPDKLAAFVDAACFCLPSRQEGFSVAILEALACGTPVVISDACHFPEVAEVGAGDIVSLDSHRIAAALARVLTHRHIGASMGAAGRSLVHSRFLWPAVADRSISLYQKDISNIP